MQDYRNQRGESALLVVAIVAGIGIAWFVFVAVKDWIRDSKDRRDHPEKYQKIERQLDGPHEPAGYSITFYP